MDPENPPRRTKPDQEPLTIDLHATPETTPTRGPDEASNETVPDERPDRTSADPSDPAAGHGFVLTDADTNTETRDDAEPATSETQHSDAADAADEARAEAAAAAFAEEPAAAPRMDRSDTPPVPRKPSRSGALAAGILGGLIALAGAGVLQYAGIVPSIGPNGSSASSSGRDLAAEVDALKAQASSSAPDAGATMALEQRLAALEQTIGASNAGGEADTLKAQVDGLTQELDTVKAALADQQQVAQTATSQLSSRIEEAEKKLDEPASDVQLARAIAVTALKTAIDRGGPFPAELDALKSISPDDPAIAGLSDFAPRGVSSRADLMRDFPDTADAMLGAIRGADPNRGVFSRLMDSAATAVRVRPVGSVEGSGPEAVVARIEDRLTNGDLKGASLEWDGLPQPAKDAGADFRARLDARIKVETLIDTAVSGAVAGSQPAKQG